MIEWATRPYYSPRGAIYEARLMEELDTLTQRGSDESIAVIHPRR